MNKYSLALSAATVLSVMLHAATASALTIGVDISNASQNYLTLVSNAIREEAKAKGATIQLEDAQGDVGRQISQVQNFIAQHVDAIVVSTVDASSTTRISHLAAEAKIPLVYVVRGPSEHSPQGVSFVHSDDTVAGRLQGEEIAKRLGHKGNIAIMQGELSDEATLKRTGGVKEIISKFPDMKIVETQTANYSRTEAIDLMSNWLLAGNKIDALAANNDEMAIGAAIALKQAGKDPKSVVIAGVDATPDAVAAVSDGTLGLTVFQDAAGQGKTAVDAAIQLAKGEHVDPEILIPFQLVTKENYKLFAK